MKQKYILFSFIAGSTSLADYEDYDDTEDYEDEFSSTNSTSNGKCSVSTMLCCFKLNLCEIGTFDHSIFFKQQPLSTH